MVIEIVNNDQQEDLINLEVPVGIAQMLIIEPPPSRNQDQGNRYVHNNREQELFRGQWREDH